jgi:hypothetical protein
MHGPCAGCSAGGPFVTGALGQRVLRTLARGCATRDAGLQDRWSSPGARCCATRIPRVQARGCAARMVADEYDVFITQPPTHTHHTRFYYR